MARSRLSTNAKRCTSTFDVTAVAEVVVRVAGSPGTLSAAPYGGQEAESSNLPSPTTTGRWRPEGSRVMTPRELPGHTGPMAARHETCLCQREAVEPTVEFRTLDRTELSRVGEIDRRERIEVLYDQLGTQLVARHGDWSAAAWDPDGHGEHSVAARVRALEHYADIGGIALGAFASERLVGIGVVVPHLRPGIAQLAFLHVSAAFRATGIGSRLTEQLEQIARTAGDSDMVVSATPSENTVRFYLGRGFQPTAEPLAELFELEPEDVHKRTVL